jgi:hypothetical protein
VLEELVRDRLDDERVAESCRAPDLVECVLADTMVSSYGQATRSSLALEHIDARRLDLEGLAHVVSHRLHHAPAQRAHPILGRHRVEHGHARQVRGQRRAPRVLALAARLGLVRLGTP